MKEEITFETYGTAKFWLEDWYSIDELEDLVKELKAVKERMDTAALEGMKQHGVIK